MVHNRIVNYNDLYIPHSEIYMALGYGKSPADKRISDLVEQQLNEVSLIFKGRYSFGFYDGEIMSGIDLKVSDKIFTVGKIINSTLQNSERFVLFTATTGAEFNTWLHEKNSCGDILDQFVADSIGSVLAEVVVGCAMNEVKLLCAEKGIKVTNPLSPGYCGWSVTSQHDLFGILNSDFCGITLNDSSLMSPIKSVSGICGIGADVNSDIYSCDICIMKGCYKNRRKTTQTT